MKLKRYSKIIGVITHHADPDPLRGVKKRWRLNKIPQDVLLLFVYGGARDRDQLLGNELHLATPEGWDTLPLKVYRFLDYCCRHYDFDHLVKVDTDCYVNIPSLVSYQAHGVDYAGRFKRSTHGIRHHRNKKRAGDHEPTEYNGSIVIPFAYGDCYVLSQRAAKAVVSIPPSELEDLHLDCGYEDLMMAKALALAEKRMGFKFTTEEWEDPGFKKYHHYPLIIFFRDIEKLCAYRPPPFERTYYFIEAIFNWAVNSLRRVHPWIRDRLAERKTGYKD